MRIKSRDTKRWAEYDVDVELDPSILQQLNDIAFFYGVEIVSTCAGHNVTGGGVYADDDPMVLQQLFAEIRFSVWYPFTQRNRLEGQRARLCINVLANVLAGADTVVKAEHNLVDDPRAKLRYRIAKSFLTVRHVLPTRDAPVAAQEWWPKIIGRLEAHVKSLA